jgi:glycosyltransferase involved in cell wall biosynthesis
MSLVQEITTPDAMRIAIVSHSHPSISKGGAEIAAYTLFVGLKEIGVDVIFIGCCSGDARSQLELGADEYAIYTQGPIYDHFYHLSAAQVERDLQAILDREQISIINFHHFFNLGVNAVRAGLKDRISIVTLHEFLAICHHHGQMITRPGRVLCSEPSPRACAACFPDKSRQQFAIRRQTFLDAFEPVDAFISPSHFLANRFADWGLPAEKIGVIENGLAKIRAGVRRSSDERASWKFGFFGQINPYKGVDLILRTCALIAQDMDLRGKIKISINGNLIGQSQEFINKFESAVREYSFLEFVGPYENSRVSSLMSACDYILVPSTWWENSPVVIQEAYAAGRPVITAGIGGMAEKVIHNISGLHFDFADPAGLFSALAEAADVEVYERLCTGLPSVADARKMATDYLSVFSHLQKTAASARINGSDF